MRTISRNIVSGTIFVLLGSAISTLGFAGVVLLGKIVGLLTSSNSTGIQALFIVIYSLFVLFLLWMTGKWIVPNYKNFKAE